MASDIFLNVDDYILCSFKISQSSMISSFVVYHQLVRLGSRPCRLVVSKRSCLLIRYITEGCKGFSVYEMWTPSLFMTYTPLYFIAYGGPFQNIIFSEVKTYGKVEIN